MSSWLWGSKEPGTPGGQGTNAEDTNQSPEERITHQIHTLNNDLSSTLHSIDSLEERKQELEEAIERMREAADEERQRAVSAFDKQRLPLEGEIKARHKELHEQQAAAREEQNRLKNEIKRADAAHKSQRKELEKRLEDEHLAEMARLRNEAASASDAKNSALLNELESSKSRLANLLEDIKRERGAGRMDPEMLAQLVKTRQENANLQKNLARLTERENARMAKTSEQLAKANDELHFNKSILSERQARKANLSASYKDLVQEVEKYKQLLDHEEDRITPSKKRRLETPSS